MFLLVHRHSPMNCGGHWSSTYNGVLVSPFFIIESEIDGSPFQGLGDRRLASEAAIVGDPSFASERSVCLYDGLHVCGVFSGCFVARVETRDEKHSTQIRIAVTGPLRCPRCWWQHLASSSWDLQVSGRSSVISTYSMSSIFLTNLAGRDRGMAEMGWVRLLPVEVEVLTEVWVELIAVVSVGAER